MTGKKIGRKKIQPRSSEIFLPVVFLPKTILIRGQHRRLLRLLARTGFTGSRGRRVLDWLCHELALKKKKSSRIVNESQGGGGLRDYYPGAISF